jgi:tetratricopeptide (TPR) repeat protein
MFEFALRGLLLFLCAGAIVASIQVAIWTTKPWWQQLFGVQDIAVTIEPVGIIEGGKVKDVESGPIASQLRHRLTQISDALSRDLSDRYAVLQKAGVSIPRTRVEGSETFQLMADTKMSFEVEVFKFDIAGLLTSINGRLDARDSVKAMIELGTPKSKLFLEVSRVKGTAQRLIIDSGPTLNEAIDVAACAVIQGYREKDGLFAGLDANSFCVFLTVFEAFQAFIIQSANSIELGGTMDLAKAKAITARLEAEPFTLAESPVIHLILASLYRLQGDSAAALKRLERAAALAPQHEFVLANVASWRKEVEEREAQARALAAAKDSPPAADELEATYQRIREQPRLAEIKYPQMLERLKSLPVAGEVEVAVFGTGFTAPPDPAELPSILAAVSTVEHDPGTDDGNGHGNATTHFLAALTPRDRLKILPVKVLSRTGQGQTFEMLRGMELAASLGADVFAIPLSLGAKDKGSAAIFERSFADLGVIAVAAAGNSPDVVALPASLPNVVGVGGAAPNGAWAAFSPTSAEVDIAAPVEDLQTSLTGSDLVRRSGTSFSTMIVTALFALAKSVAPDLGQAEILKAMKETSVPNQSGGPPTIDALAFINRIAATPSK